MRCLRFLSLALLVCVCLSVPCSASFFGLEASGLSEEEYDELLSRSSDSGIMPLDITPDDTGLVDEGHIYLSHYVYAGNSSGSLSLFASDGAYFPGNQLSLRGHFDFNREASFPFSYFADEITIHCNGTMLVSNGNEIRLELTRVLNEVTDYYSGYASNVPFRSSSVSEVLVKYEDRAGNSYSVVPDYWDISDNGSDGDLYDILVGIPALDNDCYRISITICYPASAYDLQGGAVGRRYYGFSNSVLSIKVSEHDETLGLLGGIIQWLSSIRDGIFDVSSAILSLPAQIWSFISSGLYSLFIPSQETLSLMSMRFQDLLVNRFGGLYEAGMLVTDFVGGISVRVPVGSIEFPEVTVNLAGSPFSFGGYQVDLIPSGFEWLAEIVRSAIDIFCTLLFANGMKQRLEGFLRKDG